MTIEEARQLQPGDKVFYPAERGYASGSARIREVGIDVNTSYRGQQYLWVNLGPAGVWPSCRLRK
jgi:hypothetical protein